MAETAIDPLGLRVAERKLACVTEFYGRDRWFVSKENVVGENAGLPVVVGERRWFVLKIPRCDTHGGCSTEVTVTSELHAQ